MEDMIHVEIEGNIGAGKSSIISCLHDKGYTVIKEPLSHFSNYFGHNPLVNVYVTPQSDAAIVQDFIIKTSHDYYNDIFSQDFREPGQEYLFTDRSFDSVKTFIELYYDLGYINSYAKDYLFRRYTKIQTPNRFNVKVVKVYLNVDPLLCKARIVKRARSFEENIPLSLLKTLDDILKKQALKDACFYPVYFADVSSEDTPSQIADRILEWLNHNNEW